VKTVDVVIAGGGIIGLSTALELAGSGLRVTVFERGRAMSEASWAAAGMLAARDPENPAILRPLSEFSLSLYPEYVDHLLRLSGISIPLRTRTTLQGSRVGEKLPAEAGRILDHAAASGLVPGLKGQGREFLLLEEDSLDPRDLCGALPRAAVAAGVELVEDTAVLSVGAMGTGIEVGTTAGGISAGVFLSCCGAWAGSLPGSTGQLSPDWLGIEPRKGQLVTVEMPVAESLKVVLRTPEIYLVPRGDGRIVIGATVLRAGFDKAADQDVAETLFREACALWPPLAAARIVDTWAGLRPGSADGLPLMGACWGNSWIAAGHFRNGILLAPATARIMRQLLTGQQPQVAVEMFSPQRFALAGN
jgi:glycine oxidase